MLLLHSPPLKAVCLSPTYLMLKYFSISDHLLKILCTSHNSTASFFEKGCPKFIQHSGYESVMNSQRHTDIFWFAFYSFQIIPMCFLDCCYTPS